MNARTTDIYAEYIKAWYNLDPIKQRELRHKATQELQAEGFTEIGTSDISNRVYSLFKQNGSFEVTDYEN